MSIINLNQNSYTEKQGQYLAFIFYYTKINGRPPAQTDFQRYFGVSSATVHQMILQLEKKNLITRLANKPRALEVTILQSELPTLK
jgi:DNA-binding MarR family transcriptional regulator